MANHLESASTHKKYSKISLKKRQILIELVINRGESLTKTSKKLNIKLSTSKLILRKYRKTGAVFNKKMSAKTKKSQKNIKKSIDLVQQNNCKKQQFQNDEPRIKIENEMQVSPSQEMFVPQAYYPSFSSNWIVYPWYSYPYHL